MIEEIKRLPVYKEYMQNINGAHWDLETISRKKVLEILDKYNNQESNHQKTRDSQHKRILDLEKYEKCWEELRSDLEYNTLYAPAFWVMQKIEKENKIEVE